MSASMVFTAYVDSVEMGRQVQARLLDLCALRDVRADIRIVDVTAEPAEAESGNVVGIPTVVREQPRPRRRVIGVLEDTRRVAEALGLDDRPDDVDAHTNAGVADERA
jgi:hypothetical protein